MRVRRLLAAAITVGLVAPTAAIVSTSGTSASAAVATTVVSAYADRPIVYSSASPAVFGDTLYAGVDVTSADGTNITTGSITIQRQIAGQSTWDTVATSSTPYLYNSDMKAAGNAIYRITYSGGGNYSPSVAEVAVKVTRKVDIQTISGRRAGLKGKIKPAGKVKIKVERKYGKKYKSYRKAKSNKKGRFQIFLPAPRTGKIHYRITFAGNKQVSKYVWVGYTY